MNRSGFRRAYRASKLSRLQIALVVVALLFLRWWTSSPQPEAPQNSRPEQSVVATSPESATAVVKRAVDGDTLLLTNGERVRLLGVDTPETKRPNTPVQPWGPEASDFTHNMVDGKTVTLVFDKERYDKYHRTLAFVYVGDVCLNEELIRRGLSPAMLQYPYRSDMKRRFRLAEEYAKSRKLGIWSEPADSHSHSSGHSQRHN